jgi:hypothetical protein
MLEFMKEQPVFYVQYWNNSGVTAPRRPITRSAALVLKAQLEGRGQRVLIKDARGRIVPPSELWQGHPEE